MMSRTHQNKTSYLALPVNLNPKGSRTALSIESHNIDSAQGCGHSGHGGHGTW